MKFSVFIIALFSVAAIPAQGKCAPTVMNIQYKAASGRELKVHRVCGGMRCGAPILTLLSGCSKVLCIDGSRCNTCWAVLKHSDLPNPISFNTKYGIFFNDQPRPFYSFTWPVSGSWKSTNGWILGCKNISRVGCTNRSGCIGRNACNGLVNDVAISLQGCYQTFFRYLNAENLQGCLNGVTFNGFRPGERAGNDSPSNMCLVSKEPHLLPRSA